MCFEFDNIVGVCDGFGRSLPLSVDGTSIGRFLPLSVDGNRVDGNRDVGASIGRLFVFKK